MVMMMHMMMNTSLKCKFFFLVDNVYSIFIGVNATLPTQKYFMNVISENFVTNKKYPKKFF